MKRRNMLVICIMTLSIMICACGKKTSPNTVGNMAQEVTRETETGDNEITIAGIENGNDMKSATELETKNGETIADETEKDAEESSAGGTDTDVTGADATDTGLDDEIYNNNAHFVRRGDKVYFRMPSTLEHRDISLWGEYADNTEISQALMEFSITDSRLKLLFYDSGSGIMGIGGDKLFFRDVEYNNDIACEKLSTIDLTEEQPTYQELSLGDGLVGVSPDGNYTIALADSYTDEGDYLTSIHVYEQTKCVHTYDVEDFHEVAGITNDSVFYASFEDLMQFDIVTGEVTNLGKLPVAEYGASEVQQFEIKDNCVYMGLGFYDGTGHFYSDGYYITAKIGVKDSLSYEQILSNETMSDEDEIWDYVPFYVKDGKQIPTNGIPGATYIGYVDGAIGYYDEQGEMVEVAKGFETIYDEDNYMIDVELAELAGDKMFLIRNTNLHVPEEDIGWRTAYRRVRAEYYMVDITTKKTERIADIIASDYEG